MQLGGTAVWMPVRMLSNRKRVPFTLTLGKSEAKSRAVPPCGWLVILYMSDVNPSVYDAHGKHVLVRPSVSCRNVVPFSESWREQVATTSEAMACEPTSPYILS